MLSEILEAFKEGLHRQIPQEQCIQEAQELREHLSEKQIDKMVADSFPASDPPSTY